MSGMFRLKDEAALQDLIKKGSVRESTSGMYRTHPAPKAVAPVRRAPVAGDTAVALVTGLSRPRVATAVELAPVVTAPNATGGLGIPHTPKLKMPDGARVTSWGGAIGQVPTAEPSKKESEIERRFAQQIRAAGLPEPEREYYHITGRNFTLDFAWPAIKLGVEVQGMAHRIKSKFHADMEKRILAQMGGWLVMEISGDMVRHDTAIAWLVILMGQRK